MIKSLAEFVKCCENATNDEIYDFFEFGTLNEVRDEIYLFANPSSPEPFRSAMYNLGFTKY